MLKLTNKARVYVAGAMRGIDRFNFPAFDDAAKRGRDLGFEIISPAEMDREAGLDVEKLSKGGWDFSKIPPGFDMRAAFARDIAAIFTSDAIAVLPGFERSRGVAAEMAIARVLGLPILSTKDFELLDENILDEAKRLTRGDRQDDYGSPLAEHTAIGAVWGELLKIAKWKQGEDVPAELVADLMIALKLVRDQHRRKRDNATDQAGYADCRWRIIEEKLAKGMAV